MSDNDNSSERLTIKSTPPNLRKTQRRTYWPTVFAEARECPGEWLRTEKWFHRATAAQVASDLRNSHRRAPEKMRMSGCLPGDRWETRWQNDPVDPDLEHFYVWLRFDGTAPTQCVRTLDDVEW
jgi:hypothetical protein